MRLVFGLAVVAVVFSSQLSAQHNRVCHSSDKIQSTDLNSLAEVGPLELPQRIVVAAAAAAGLVVMAAVVAVVTVGQIAGYLWSPSCFV